jgi:hypothetical protein
LEFENLSFNIANFSHIAFHAWRCGGTPIS